LTPYHHTRLPPPPPNHHHPPSFPTRRSSDLHAGPDRLALPPLRTTSPSMGRSHSAAIGPSPSLGLMSIRKPVSLAARRAFWPSRPMASDSWLRGTSTVAVRLTRSIVTLSAFAGPSA